MVLSDYPTWLPPVGFRYLDKEWYVSVRAYSVQNERFVLGKVSLVNATSL